MRWKSVLESSLTLCSLRSRAISARCSRAISSDLCSLLAAVSSSAARCSLTRCSAARCFHVCVRVEPWPKRAKLYYHDQQTTLTDRCQRHRWPSGRQLKLCSRRHRLISSVAASLSGSDSDTDTVCLRVSDTDVQTPVSRVLSQSRCRRKRICCIRSAV